MVCQIPKLPQQTIAYPLNFLCWYTPKSGIKVKVFSPCEQVVNCIKLRTVAHTLMDFRNIG